MGPDVAFGHDAGDCSVCCCGDNLADWLGTDVPCDVDTGDVGLAVFVCDNVAIVIEVDFSAAHVGHGLIADEDETPSIGNSVSSPVLTFSSTTLPIP